MKNNEKIKKTKLANSIPRRALKTSNAFTLIELLAIIVILAIIAVITVPIILNVIDNAKKGSIKDSAYGYKDAVNKYYVSELYENENIKLNGTYLVENDGTMQGMDLTSNSYTDKLDISVSGTAPTGGYLNYENSILKDGCLTMDEYKVTIENGEVTKTEKGSCESASLTACDSPNFKSSPEEWFTFDASTNTITGFSDAWDGTTDIVIPCQMGGVDVVNVGNDTNYTGVFNEKGLSSVIFNDNIKRIGTGAFAANGLNSIILSSSIEKIDFAAFQNNSLDKLEIPNGVQTIGYASFSGNKIEFLEIPETVVFIDTAAFMGNNLFSIVINSKNISFGSPVFYKTSTSNLNLTKIYNNTGKSFEWDSIINGTSGYNFETGIVENEYGNVEIKG